MNGQLIKSWEVHCYTCEAPLLGIGRFGSSADAAEEARRQGWRTRQGLWICAACVETRPPGTKVFPRHPELAGTNDHD